MVLLPQLLLLTNNYNYLINKPHPLMRFFVLKALVLFLEQITYVSPVISHKLGE